MGRCPSGKRFKKRRLIRLRGVSQELRTSYRLRRHICIPVRALRLESPPPWPLEALATVAGMGHVKAYVRHNVRGRTQRGSETGHRGLPPMRAEWAARSAASLPLGSVRHTDHDHAGHAPGPTSRQKDAGLAPGMRRQLRALRVNMMRTTSHHNDVWGTTGALTVGLIGHP